MTEMCCMKYIWGMGAFRDENEFDFKFNKESSKMRYDLIGWQPVSQGKVATSFEWFY